MAAHRQILLEGHTPESLLQLSDEELRAFVFADEPLVSRAGSAEVLDERAQLQTNLNEMGLHLDDIHAIIRVQQDYAKTSLIRLHAGAPQAALRARLHHTQGGAWLWPALERAGGAGDGGRLLLESEGPGKGATATLELPVSQSL